MKTRVEKKTNTSPKKSQFIEIAGCNPCPRCGAAAYSIIKDGYYTGCRKCGMEKGAKTFITSEIVTNESMVTRMQWNHAFLESELSTNALTKVGAVNGDYLVVERFDEDICFVAHTKEDAMAFIYKNEDTYFDIYLVENYHPLKQEW